MSGPPTGIRPNQQPLNTDTPGIYSSPTSATTPASTSFKTNVNRQKTKRWVEAKSFSYDGDDWGEVDDYDEYGAQEEAPPPKPTGLRQRGQSIEQSDAPPPRSAQPQPTIQRSGSFNKGDETAAFSAGAAPAPNQAPATRFSQMNVARPDTAAAGSGDHARAIPARGPPLQVQTPGAPRSGVVGAPPIDPTAAPRAQRPDATAPPNPQRGDSLPSGGQATSASTPEDPQNRRDFQPSAAPSPLKSAHTQASQTATGVTDDRHHPVRKSSLSQVAPPTLPPVTAPSQSSPQAVSDQDGAAARGRANSSSKKLPFIRPADIYKRVEEERERERQSLDSSRPSTDSLTRPTERDLGDVAKGGGKRASPDSVGRSRSRPSFEAGDDVDSQIRQKTTLDPVQERKSEYGFDGLAEQKKNLQSTGAPQAAPTSDAEPPKQTPAPLGRNSDDPVMLPNLSGLSGFGDDFLSFTQPRLQRVDGPSATSQPKQTEAAEGLHPSATPQDTSPQASLQHQPSLGIRSAVNQAFERPDDGSTPATPLGSESQRSQQSLPSRSDSASTSGISPIMSRVPSGAIGHRPQAADGRDASIPMIAEESETTDGAGSRPSSMLTMRAAGDGDGDLSSKLGNRQVLTTAGRRNSPARSPAIEVSRAHQAAEQGEVATATPVDAESNASTQGQVYAAREDAAAATQPHLSIDTDSIRPALPGGWISYATTRDGSTPSETPNAGAGASTAPLNVHTDDDVPTQRQPSALRNFQGALSPDVGPAPTPPPKDTPTQGVGGDGTAEPSSYFPAPAPSDRVDAKDVTPPRHAVQEEDKPFSGQLSTEASPYDQESDRLRKEIVKSLSPSRETFETSNMDSPGGPGITRENTVGTLPSEYETYWAGAREEETPRSAHPGLSSSQDKTPPPSQQGGVTDQGSRPALPGAHNAATASTPGSDGRAPRYSWENVPPPEQDNLQRDAEMGLGNRQPEAELASPDPVEVDATPISRGPQGQSQLDRSGAVGPGISADGNVGDPSQKNLQDDNLPEHDAAGGRPIQSSELLSEKPLRYSAASNEKEFVDGLQQPTTQPGGLEASSKELERDRPENPSPLPLYVEEPPTASSSLPAAPQAKLLSFREILAIKSPADRINSYNSTREQFATMDTGIAQWLSATIAQHPEHVAPAVSGQGGQASTPLRPATGASNPTGYRTTPSASYTPQSSLAPSGPGASQASSLAPSPSSAGKAKHSGGLFGGKGLFSKGRSKFRSSGGGEKGDDADDSDPESDALSSGSPYESDSSERSTHKYSDAVSTAEEAPERESEKERSFNVARRPVPEATIEASPVTMEVDETSEAHEDAAAAPDGDSVGSEEVTLLPEDEDDDDDHNEEDRDDENNEDDNGRRRDGQRGEFRATAQRIEVPIEHQQVIQVPGAFPSKDGRAQGNAVLTTGDYPKDVHLRDIFHKINRAVTSLYVDLSEDRAERSRPRRPDASRGADTQPSRRDDAPESQRRQQQRWDDMVNAKAAKAPPTPPETHPAYRNSQLSEERAVEDQAAEEATGKGQATEEAEEESWSEEETALEPTVGLQHASKEQDGDSTPRQAEMQDSAAIERTAEPAEESSKSVAESPSTAEPDENSRMPTPRMPSPNMEDLSNAIRPFAEPSGTPSDSDYSPRDLSVSPPASASASQPSLSPSTEPSRAVLSERNIGRLQSTLDKYDAATNSGDVAPDPLTARLRDSRQVRTEEAPFDARSPASDDTSSPYDLVSSAEQPSAGLLFTPGRSLSPIIEVDGSSVAPSTSSQHPASLRRTMSDVSLAVSDWSPMVSPPIPERADTPQRDWLGRRSSGSSDKTITKLAQDRQAESVPLDVPDSNDEDPNVQRAVDPLLSPESSQHPQHDLNPAANAIEVPDIPEPRRPPPPIEEAIKQNELDDERKSDPQPKAQSKLEPERKAKRTSFFGSRRSSLVENKDDTDRAESTKQNAAGGKLFGKRQAPKQPDVNAPTIVEPVDTDKPRPRKLRRSASSIQREEGTEKKQRFSVLGNLFGRSSSRDRSDKRADSSTRSVQSRASGTYSIDDPGRSDEALRGVQAGSVPPSNVARTSSSADLAGSARPDSGDAQSSTSLKRKSYPSSADSSTRRNASARRDSTETAHSSERNVHAPSPSPSRPAEAPSASSASPSATRSEEPEYEQQPIPAAYHPIATAGDRSPAGSVQWNPDYAYMSHPPYGPPDYGHGYPRMFSPPPPPPQQAPPYLHPYGPPAAFAQASPMSPVQDPLRYARSHGGGAYYGAPPARSFSPFHYDAEPAPYAGRTMSMTMAPPLPMAIPTPTPSHEDFAGHQHQQRPWSPYFPNTPNDRPDRPETGYAPRPPPHPHSYSYSYSSPSPSPSHSYPHPHPHSRPHSQEERTPQRSRSVQWAVQYNQPPSGSGPGNIDMLTPSPPIVSPGPQQRGYHRPPYTTARASLDGKPLPPPPPPSKSPLRTHPWMEPEMLQHQQQQPSSSTLSPPPLSLSSSSSPPAGYAYGQGYGHGHGYGYPAGRPKAVGSLNSGASAASAASATGGGAAGTGRVQYQRRTSSTSSS
ncbi:MAG: hypothetical protein M1825_003772 [Sarcosagium campestre]|nr:MAG: hypothetical protein M1825_003772 [Sarcosagium campestre]